ncbi:hypothetical protein FDK38_001858 [Candidozyma auris]|uniref:hypothetical_protein n=1 Tax=Candidozyma auris TaxID=498019 RepID=UPI000D2E477D|nr:hypothetical_protein [[Candida] auris]QEO21713.1 hypothetical_protein [[Candida] auris]QRG37483.1 hypothetical protein FDK38_001858 [[Candida] auris]GBL47788.1 hypothetical protein CAJCM15448_00620 [[Candida] auris]
MSLPDRRPREILCEGPEGAQFAFYAVLFDDKLVLNILIDGVMDTSFDLPLSTSKVIDSQVLASDESLGIEPVVLVGDPHNLKLQVVAGQIGKVVYSMGNRKNVILTMGSRWFGKDPKDGDFDKLMFVLGKIKELLLKP